jgi:hypothetical protein
MFFTALKSIILSGIFICIIHYIIYFFIETLTVPKVKDLINISSKQQEILQSIQSREQPKSEAQTLKTFLKKNNSEQINAINSKPYLGTDPIASSCFASNMPSSSNIISFSDYE